ncbi:MAG: mercury resistance system transport protein MerF [Balneolaceae bacterium]
MSKFDFIRYNKFTKAGFWTALIAGICCFTPLLVWGFAFAGLAAYTAYIDFVILPVFFIALAVFFFGYWRHKEKRG